METSPNLVEEVGRMDLQPASEFPPYSFAAPHNYNSTFSTQQKIKQTTFNGFSSFPLAMNCPRTSFALCTFEQSGVKLDLVRGGNSFWLLTAVESADLIISATPQVFNVQAFREGPMSATSEAPGWFTAASRDSQGLVMLQGSVGLVSTTMDALLLSLRTVWKLSLLWLLPLLLGDGSVPLLQMSPTGCLQLFEMMSAGCSLWLSLASIWFMLQATCTVGLQLFPSSRCLMPGPTNTGATFECESTFNFFKSKSMNLSILWRKNQAV